jgi:acyl-coenzyme A thioesterase PaaI-like protein
MISLSGSGNVVRKVWDNLSPLPGGKVLFSKLLGRVAPYTGTIDARCLDLRTGFARVEMRDRRAVRNHLRSVHAIALINLAEVTTGLAMMYAIPDDARGIISGLSMSYLKKARGRLTSECRIDPPRSSVRQEYQALAEIRDQSGEVVARGIATWLIGPRA